MEASTRDYTNCYVNEGAVILQIRNSSINKTLSETKIQICIQKANSSPDLRIFIVDYADSTKIVASIPISKELKVRQRKAVQVEFEHKNYIFILIFDDEKLALDFLSSLRSSSSSSDVGKVMMGTRSTSTENIPGLKKAISSDTIIIDAAPPSPSPLVTNNNNSGSGSGGGSGSSSPSPIWDNARRTAEGRPKGGLLSKSLNPTSPSLKEGGMGGSAENVLKQSPIRIGRLPPGNHRGGSTPPSSSSSDPPSSSSSPSTSTSMPLLQPTSSPSTYDEKLSPGSTTATTTATIIANTTNITSAISPPSSPFLFLSQGSDDDVINDDDSSTNNSSSSSSSSGNNNDNNNPQTTPQHHHHTASSSSSHLKFDRRPSFLETEILRSENRTGSKSNINRECNKITIPPRWMICARLFESLLTNFSSYFTDIVFPDAFVKSILPENVRNWSLYLDEVNAYAMEWIMCVTLEWEQLSTLHKLLKNSQGSGYVDIHPKDVLDPDIICELVKIYFMDKAPLITFEFFDPPSSYDEIIKTNDKDKEKEYIIKLLKSQPPHNITTLKFLLQMLSQVKEKHESNHVRMSDLSAIYSRVIIAPKDLYFKKEAYPKVTKKLRF